MLKISEGHFAGRPMSFYRLSKGCGQFSCNLCKTWSCAVYQIAKVANSGRVLEYRFNEHLVIRLDSGSSVVVLYGGCHPFVNVRPVLSIVACDVAG